MRNPEFDATERPEYLQEYAPLLEALENIGTEVLEMQQKRGKGFVRYKKDGSEVSKGDEWSEERLTQFLRTHFPEDGFLGEEGTSADVKQGRIWIIDSIDGSRPYANGDPDFGISIGCDDFAAIRYPALGTTICARKGEGAFRNNERISLYEEPIALAQANLAVSFCHDVTMRHQFRQTFDVLQRCRIFENRQCGVDGFRRIIEGQLDTMIVGGASIYDLGAMLPIAQELGLHVTCLNASIEPLDVTQKHTLFFIIVSCSKELHHEIVGILQPANIDPSAH